MNFEVKNQGQWTILSVNGRVDAHTSGEFEAACRKQLDQGVKMLAISLEEVPYMSSAGLRVLLATLKLANKDAGRLVLINPQQNVKEVLEISGFSSLFHIVGSQAELV